MTTISNLETLSSVRAKINLALQFAEETTSTIAPDYATVAEFDAAVDAGLERTDGKSVIAAGTVYVAETAAAIDDIPAGYRPANWVYTRAEIEAQTDPIAPGCNVIHVLENGFAVPYQRVALATDLIGGDLSTWRKAGITPTDALAIGTEVANSLPPVVKAMSAGLDTRADFVTWQSTRTFNVGDVVRAGGLQYEFDDASTAISDLEGWKPFGEVYAEHFGLSTSGTAAANTTALNAMIAYCPSRQIPMNIGPGTFEFNGPIILKQWYSVIQGAGKDLTILAEATVDGDGVRFKRDAGSRASNSLYYCGLRDLTIQKKSGLTVTDGLGLHVDLPHRNGFSNVRVAGFVRGVLQSGGDQCMWDNVIAECVTGAGTVFSNSYAWKFEAAQLDDLSYQPVWSTFASKLITRANLRAEYSVIIESGDGLKITDSILGYGTVAAVKVKPTNDSLNETTLANCYFDGVWAVAVVPIGIHVPSFTPVGTVNVLQIDGGHFTSCTDHAIKVEGPLTVRMTGGRIAGWSDQTLLNGYLVHVDHADAQLELTGTRISQGAGGVNVVNAAKVKIDGCDFRVITQSGKACINFGTAVTHAIVGDCAFYPESSAVSLIDTATGARAYGNNYSTDGGAIMNRGTWTPAMSFGGTSSTITSSEAYWRLVDDMIEWHATISWTSKTGTGNVAITGLPFTLANTGSSYPGQIYPVGLAAGIASEGVFLTVTHNSGPEIRIAQSSSGGSTRLTDADFNTTGTIHISGRYRKA